jgi:hypothetical protein
MANASRLIDRDTAMVEKLQALLEPLIRWRSGVSDLYFGMAARCVEEIQAEVSSLLKDPIWIDREMIAAALRQAGAAVAAVVGRDYRGSINLKMLLKPPLKAWEGHFEDPETPAGWRSLSEANDDFADTLRADYKMTRLGHIIDAWALEVDGKITEIIECWGALFWPHDLYGSDRQAWFGCRTFYRYHIENGWEGQIYPSREQAACAEGGYSVEAAREEGLAWGLGRDDISDSAGTHSDLLPAADRAWLLEVKDTELYPYDFTWSNWQGAVKLITAEKKGRSN